jgi:hypothetical protein
MTRTRTPDSAWSAPEPERVLPLAGAAYATMRQVVSALSPLGELGRHVSRAEARALLREARQLVTALEGALAEPGTAPGAQSPDRST